MSGRRRRGSSTGKGCSTTRAGVPVSACTWPISSRTVISTGLPRFTGSIPSNPASISAISPALANLVTLLLFTVIGIVVAAISFGFVLNGWRAICDDAGAAPPANAPPVAGFEA